MSCLIRLIQHYWIPLTLITLVLITALSLWPLATLPAVPGSDKTHHFIAYAALVVPVALRRPQGWPLMVLGCIGWSGAIELLQPYVNRYGEWLDLLANGGGVACGVVLGRMLRGLVGGQGGLTATHGMFMLPGVIPLPSVWGESLPMIVMLSAPFCLLFVYLAYQLIKKKHYREAMLVGGVAVVLLVVTLGFVGLGYLWSTAPMEVTL